MSTVTAILEPDADGSLHVPLPPELRAGRVRIEATLERVDLVSEGAEEERQRRVLSALASLRTRNPFQSVQDPVAWQRESREDVELPGRGEHK